MLEAQKGFDSKLASLIRDFKNGKEHEASQLTHLGWFLLRVSTRHLNPGEQITVSQLASAKTIEKEIKVRQRQDYSKGKKRCP